MGRNYLKWMIIFLLVVGIIGAGTLVWEEFKTGNGCPKIATIPVCMVILICFVVPLVAHLQNKWHSIYFLFTGMALFIATVASTMQYTGNGECPKMEGGIPLCYLSFLIFSALILKKVVLLKTESMLGSN